MDSDFWASRLAAAKRQFIHHHHNRVNSRLDRLNVDEFEGEEKRRPDFPCPFCYEHFDIASLCSHLGDEHSGDSRVTVCPICAVKVARDMLSHITLQHGHLFKFHRRHRLCRVAMPNSQTHSFLGRDLREAHLQLLLGGIGHRSSSATSSSAIIDPLLSSLVLNFPVSEAEEISKLVYPVLRTCLQRLEHHNICGNQGEGSNLNYRSKLYEQNATEEWDLSEHLH